MPLNTISLDVLHNAFANIRLESLELPDELRNILMSQLLEGSLTTTDILKKIIEG